MVAARNRAALVALACAGVLSGCSFDASGIDSTDASVSREPDARPTADAAGCDDDIVAVLAADGVTEAAESGGPLTQVLVGDTVELSAAGSCARAGIASYEWSISPVDSTGDTILPDRRSETITLYPARAERYVVTLEITDEAGESLSVTRYAIESVGWRRLEASGDDRLEEQPIAGVAAGAGRLWITSSAGSFVARLDELGSLNTMNDALSGDEIDKELAAVSFGAGAVWLASRGKDDELWRVSDGERVDEIALSREIEVRAIDAFGGDLAVASKDGAFVVSGSDGFTTIDRDPDLFAVAASGSAIWFGADRLYRDDATDEPVDPLDGQAGDDARIRGLDFGSGGELWIATREHGVVRASAQTGEGEIIYRAQDTALPSDDVRAIAVEREGRFAGDVWVATGWGAARLKRDRGVWVAMGANHGLSRRTDMTSIAVARDPEERGIYAGTTDGVVYLRAP